MSGGELTVVAVLMAATVVVFAWSGAERRGGAVLAGLAVGLGVRLAVVLADEGFAVPFANDDAERFHNAAQAAVDNGGVGALIATGGSQTYVGLLGVIYHISGPSPWIGKGVNVAASLISILVILKTLDTIDPSRRKSWLVVWLWAVLPPLILNGSLLLRESLVSLLIALAIYFLYSERTRLSVLYFALLVTLASVLHGGVFTFLVASLFILLMHIGSAKSRLMTLVLSSIAFIAFLPLVLPKLLSSLGISNLSEVTLGGLIGSSDRFTRGDTAYTVPFGDSALLLPLHLVLRIFYFLLTPWPWELRGIADLLIAASSAVLAVLTVRLVWTGLSKRVSPPFTRAVAWGVLVFTFTFAIGVGNAGTALRHRVKLWPAVLIALALPPLRSEERAGVLPGLGETRSCSQERKQAGLSVGDGTSSGGL